jgi:NACalpha-BTF3-like transcription factor
MEPRNGVLGAGEETVFSLPIYLMVSVIFLNRAVKYCSVDCQKAHWSEHKKNCQGNHLENDVDFFLFCSQFLFAAPQVESQQAVEVDPFDDIDVRIVMGQTGCPREKAIEGLRKSKGGKGNNVNFEDVELLF